LGTQRKKHTLKENMFRGCGTNSTRDEEYLKVAKEGYISCLEKEEALFLKYNNSCAPSLNFAKRGCRQQA
jgi:hypothetical protein